MSSTWFGAIEGDRGGLMADDESGPRGIGMLEREPLDVGDKS